MYFLPPGFSFALSFCYAKYWVFTDAKIHFCVHFVYILFTKCTQNVQQKMRSTGRDLHFVPPCFARRCEARIEDQLEHFAYILLKHFACKMYAKMFSKMQPWWRSHNRAEHAWRSAQLCVAPWSYVIFCKIKCKAS